MPPSPPSDRPALVTPVADYEPAPVGMGVCRSKPALHPKPSPHRAPRPLRAPHPGAARPRGAQVSAAPVLPRAAAMFAESALRRVFEVIDRRRPVAQLQPLLAPSLIDGVIALTRVAHPAAATLRRIRLRPVDSADVTGAEVFGVYSRGGRLRAVAARIELVDDRWRIVALQIG